MCISVKLEVHNFVLQTFGANIELYRHAEIGDRATSSGSFDESQHAGNND